MPESAAPSLPFVLPQSPAAADLLAKYFRGLGDPTTVRIQQLLADHGEPAVGELVTRLVQSQSRCQITSRVCAGVGSLRPAARIQASTTASQTIARLGLGRGLLGDNAVHVAACGQIDSTHPS